ncbi:MAG TPA: hypothetical protein VH274_08400 [Mycobacteriales bacterium]|nr:hypothetical protein [Mycobacteriales bacterium]
MARARRACTALALTGIPLLVGLPSAHAEAFFQVETNAAAVHITVTQEPASSIITASLFDDAIAYAASEFDTGGSSEALAAPAFPGRLVVQGPELLCTQLFSCPATPPSYPFLADASYPRRGHDTATASGSPIGAGPFVVSPVTATAEADAASNTASTAAGRADLLAGTPGAVTVGASAATTSVRSAGQRIVVTVTATASDLTVAGLLHIASVRSTDQVVLATGRAPVAHPSITVGGVTVSGHRATIDDQGVHVDGAGGGALAREIGRRGVTIRSVGTRHRHTRTGSRSEAVGLSIDVAVPISGVPYIPNPLPPLPPPFDQIPALPGVNANGTYVGHITIGAVGAAAGVGTEPTFTLGSTVARDTPASTPGQSTPAGGVPLGGNDLVGKLATPAPTAAPNVAAPGPLRGFVDLISKAQIETLYAVLALGSLALFIGWRATVAIRMGRSR